MSFECTTLKRCVGLALAMVLTLTFPPRSHAVSEGLEVVAIGVGAVSVSVGKARNNRALRYVGWGLVATGGTAVSAQGVVLVFAAAFMGAMIGGLMGGIMNPLWWLTQGGRRADNFDSNGARTSLQEVVREIDAEIALAQTLAPDEGADSLVLASIAQALQVSVGDLAGDFTRVRDNAQANVKSLIRSSDVAEKQEIIERMLVNYRQMKEATL